MDIQSYQCYNFAPQFAPPNEEYKNRDTKNKAWEEVAQILLHDFEDLDEAKQQEAIKLIQQRWKSARDAYRRDKSKVSASKSGQAAKTFKKYIYFENLNFLNKTLDLNETDTNFRMGNMAESQNVEDMSENEDAIIESVYEEDSVHTQTKKRRKKNKILMKN
ncbi:unnamed protein product [Ceutorhynchus assimilis]|uniref:MADF domain-containing protein n=1 Tax=Ceutorhynchus assimilis TaxID=467358 RepID=A0A9N9QI57_9CUCU|nr:unnamed protein product [Ceutorhynchus assimilis]